MRAERAAAQVKQMSLYRSYGSVERVIGLMVESRGPKTNVGDICYIYGVGSDTSTAAEVVGFRQEYVLLMPLESLKNISPGCTVEATGKPLKIKAGAGLIGRVLNGMGEPIDHQELPEGLVSVSSEAAPPAPLDRPRIKNIMPTGVRVIDSLLTMGEGQRIGIFAGSGVGKSTLLSMITRYTEADINIIALIGERGREVRDFIERDLGEEGMAKSVLVVATSDQPASMRIQGAYTATAIAEYFRSKGKKVNFMMDSITRFAMARREIGLAIGEPPTTKGYPPSVFALLPGLLERTGTSKEGSITAFYTVLVDGDDMNEPIADAVRGILDGHFVLERSLANKNHFPAIDVLQSVSRVMSEITNETHQQAASKVKSWLAAYREAEDLIRIGAYRKGSSRETDEALEKLPAVEALIQQRSMEASTMEQTLKKLQNVMEEGAS
ncbi:flagellar protein export ATPase FliI [Marinococcus halophilus]|uniref:Flagellum-specific ATP synthase n=1 Tax=Marinococcus halophilus TaxID=1371 RepID=A0A510Y281_MARHA|nr:flagellar protein export ATPase FliI [Marinococcus halophilus]OZT81438.1 flagellar protein export ATPase FliI [Marinococcus halophilus]GEK57394.1 flagellum-specific ATP synthase [Marinococcus halophilus]